MDLGIGGLRVVVTGGAAGLGAEIVRRFLAEGARVHACDIDAVAPDRPGGETGGENNLSASTCDVADPAAVERMLDTAVGAMGGGELVMPSCMRLKRMPGRVLRVVALDPGAVEDLPAWCRMTRNDLLAHDPATRSFWIRSRSDWS